MEPDPLLEKGLPSDIETEKHILGAICLNGDLISQALSFLDRQDFYLDSHRRIFDAMVSLQQSGNPIDVVTLPALLLERKELEQVGGATYLGLLLDGLPQTDNIEHYCRIVKYKAREREAIRVLSHSVTELLDGEDELDTILDRVETRIARIADSSINARTFSGVYPNLSDFFKASFEESEEIIYGVHRGEVAAMDAITNYGKSTLLYNTCLSIAAGETCRPLAPIVTVPRRVLYIDSESPAGRARSDLQKMINSIGNDELGRENFIIVVDAVINNLPLNLSKHDHFKRIVALAKAQGVDLVVIDTAASAFELQDENSNAEVTRTVMNPLKRLAREVNCAVVFSHHIGKSNETQSGEGAYRGRGASAFGTLSRTVFTIEKDAKKGPEYVVINCVKIKGQPFEPTLLKLNHDTRWFEVCDEKPEARPEPPTAQEIAELVTRQSATTTQICDHFKDRAGLRTIKDRIAEAERLGLIEKPTQKGAWHLCNSKSGHFSDIAEVAAESTVASFVQSASPIGNCTNAQMRSNGRSQHDFSLCPSCSMSGLLHSYCDHCGELIR